MAAISPASATRATALWYTESSTSCLCQLGNSMTSNRHKMPAKIAPAPTRPLRSSHVASSADLQALLSSFSAGADTALQSSSNLAAFSTDPGSTCPPASSGTWS